jgi:hypothetical protein
MKINEIVNSNPNAMQQQGKVKRASGSEIEIEDPKKPGITTTVDLKKANVSQDDKGNTTIDLTAKQPAGPNKIKPNSNVTLTMPKK